MTKKPRDPAVYVWDMINEVEFVERALCQGSLYDEMISRAVLRSFTVLGEAAKRIEQEARSKAAHIPWQEIVDMRNVVSHEYEEINLQKIEAIITQHFTSLKNDLLDLYKALTGMDYHAN
jgi:uncharacterized protein with HEPN domain